VTREEAIIALSAMVRFTDPPALTTDDLNEALTASRLVDVDGRPPADPDYVEGNFDLNYAAALLWEKKAVLYLSVGQLTEFSSEGSRFKKEPPNFQALADYYRGLSTAAGTGNGVEFVAIEPERKAWLLPRSSYRSC
jgi:hypothetical protein